MILLQLSLAVTCLLTGGEADCGDGGRCCNGCPPGKKLLGCLIKRWDADFNWLHYFVLKVNVWKSHAPRTRGLSAVLVRRDISQIKTTPSTDVRNARRASMVRREILGFIKNTEHPVTKIVVQILVCLQNMLRNVRQPQTHNVRVALVSCAPEVTVQLVRKTNVSRGRKSGEQVSSFLYQPQVSTSSAASKRRKCSWLCQIMSSNWGVGFRSTSSLSLDKSGGLLWIR